MFEFVNWLRALAAVLITNSHYDSIWPVSELAVGGLVGNVIFFAVSGYCLFDVKLGFGKWYLRRLSRVVPVALCFTILTVIVGIYPVRNLDDFVRHFVYPSNYVFFLWLTALYVPYYFWAKRAKVSRCVERAVPAITVAVWLLVYVAAVPKGSYVVDNVDSPFILFLYFVAMQTGGLLKKNGSKLRALALKDVVALCLALAAYVGSKFVLERQEWFLPLQIFNQFIVLALLFVTFTVFLKLEERLRRAPEWLRRMVSFVSGRTLHIYVVQFVIIDEFSALAFPLNFLVVTALVLVGAATLKFVEDVVRGAIARLSSKRSSANGKA